MAEQWKNPLKNLIWGGTCFRSADSNVKHKIEEIEFYLEEPLSRPLKSFKQRR